MWLHSLLLTKSRQLSTALVTDSYLIGTAAVAQAIVHARFADRIQSTSCVTIRLLYITALRFAATTALTINTAVAVCRVKIPKVFTGYNIGPAVCCNLARTKRNPATCVALCILAAALDTTAVLEYRFDVHLDEGGRIKQARSRTTEYVSVTNASEEYPRRVVFAAQGPIVTS